MSRDPLALSWYVYYLLRFIGADGEEKRYVGSTKNYDDRKTTHKSVCKSGRRKQLNLYGPMRLAGGWSVVEVVKIETSPRPVTRDEANERERELAESKEFAANLNTIRAHRTKEEKKIQKLEASAKYYADNSDKVITRSAKRRAEHPEKERARLAKRYAENREEMKARSAKRRAEHREEIKAQRAKKYAENAEKERASAAKRSAERITCELCSAEICRGKKGRHVRTLKCRAAAAESKKENREDAKV